MKPDQQGLPVRHLLPDPDKTGKLIYDERCVQNLAVYLTKAEVKNLGKMAIVATLACNEKHYDADLGTTGYC